MNHVVLLVFGPLLILVGILGFVIPESKAMTSGAAPYNVFHIVFGVVGTSIALVGSNGPIRAFVIGFGAIDLYQALASRASLFPKRHFRWKPADDILHVVVGAALVVIGIAGS
jgi:hypothetical protein